MLFPMQLLSEIWCDFRQNLPQLLVYDIFFKIVVSVIYGPVSAWVLSRLISASGSFIVGNEQIVSFVLSPIGIVVLIFSGASALAVFFTEQAGLIVIASRARSGHVAGYREAIWSAIKWLPRLFELGVRQVVKYALYLTPFLGVAWLCYMILTAGHDVNYLLTVKPPAFWIGLAMALILGTGAIFVVGMLFVRWFFSVPFCVLEAERPSTALRRSRMLVEGNMLRVTTIIFGWNLIIAAGGWLILLLVDLSVNIVLKSLGESLTIVVPVVVVSLAVYGLVIAALTFVWFTTNCLLLTALYYDIGREKGMAPARGPRDDWITKEVGVFPWKAFWGVAILTAIVAAALSFRTMEALDVESHISVTAHRGSSRYAPENTLSAVKRAIEDGADFAEIDVQETADGVVVVLHDTDLMRVAGMDKKIWEITYEELKKLDAGSWFSPDFKGERIPTLAQMIELAKGKIKLNIELKFNGHDRQLTESVVRIVQEHDFESQCVISSLSLEGVIKVRELNPDLKTGYIIAKALGDFWRVDSDFLSLNRGIVSADAVASARRRGKEIHVWTVNDAAGMSYCIDLGVDNILTDVPDILVEVIKERASLSDVEKLLLRASHWLMG